MHSFSARDKLVPCTWLLSGALEAWRLRFRLHK